MQMLLKVLLLLFVNLAFAQKENIIKVYVSKNGAQNSMRLSYYDLTNVIILKSLEPGKHRFYLKVNDSCVISVATDKSPKLTEEEMKHLNYYFAGYKLEYYDNEVLVSDCSKFSGQTFPITITTLP